MHTIEIPERNKALQIPASWDECSPRQARHILRLAFAAMDGQIAIPELRLRALAHLARLKTGIPYLARQKLGMNHQANARLYQLAEQLCAWIFRKGPHGELELSFDTVRNPFPTLAKNRRGPADMLADLAIGEFAAAIAALHRYFDSRDSQDLDTFLALIYRPRKNGARIPFHRHDPDPRPFARVPPWQKQATAIWFANCVRALQTEELTVNGTDIDLSPLFPRTAEPPPPAGKTDLGWTGILLGIAEAGTFGNASQAARAPLYDALTFLLKKHQENQERKKT